MNVGVYDDTYALSVCEFDRMGELLVHPPKMRLIGDASDRLAKPARFRSYDTQ